MHESSAKNNVYNEWLANCVVLSYKSGTSIRGSSLEIAKVSPEAHKDKISILWSSRCRRFSHAANAIYRKAYLEWYPHVQAALTLSRIFSCYNLQTHLRLTSMYPFLHRHSKLPKVFLHSVLLSGQMSSLNNTTHSFKSKIKTSGQSQINIILPTSRMSSLNTSIWNMRDLGESPIIVFSFNFNTFFNCRITIEIYSIASLILRPTLNNLHFHSLWRRANARNVIFKTLYKDLFTLSTHLILLNYPVILSNQRSTTVSLESFPLFFHTNTLRYLNIIYFWKKWRWWW